jgi:hypothetical protein
MGMSTTCPATGEYMGLEAHITSCAHMLDDLSLWHRLIDADTGLEGMPPVHSLQDVSLPTRLMISEV